MISMPGDDFSKVTVVIRQGLKGGFNNGKPFINANHCALVNINPANRTPLCHFGFDAWVVL